MSQGAMSRRALIVDAAPATSETLQNLLRPSGIDATTVAQSKQAGGLLQDQKFDVVFVDLASSPEAGIELTRKARSSGLNRMTPIILITGDRQRGVFAQGFNAGASFIVHKPLDKSHLIKLLRVAQGSMEHERRRFRRIECAARVRLTLANSQVDGETIDVSLNGALVRASRTFPVGSSLQVDLYLPSAAKPIKGVGSVRRVTAGNRMGLQMDGFSIEDSGRLQDYLLPLLIGEAREEVGR